MFAWEPPVRRFLLLARIAGVVARVRGIALKKKKVFSQQCGVSHAKQVVMYRHLSIPAGSLNSHGADVRRTVSMFGSNFFHRLRTELRRFSLA